MRATDQDESKVYLGLFVANTNQRINSDVSGEYQILKRVSALASYIQALSTLGHNPIKINILEGFQ